MFLFNLGKIVCFIIFQTDKCLLPLLYCFQNLFEDVTSDVSDENDVDELYEQSKLVFSKYEYNGQTGGANVNIEGETC